MRLYRVLLVAVAPRRLPPAVAEATTVARLVRRRHRAAINRHWAASRPTPRRSPWRRLELALTITAYDAQNYVIQNAGTPTFSSSNTAVAEVDGNGQCWPSLPGRRRSTCRSPTASVTRTAVVTVTVTGVLPNDIGVIASSGDYVFTPKVVAIQQGGSVNWTFGPLEHTVTFSIARGAPASITSGYSGTVSRTFATRGNFTYNCQIHSGMGGQVIVR